jgi:hypothetical protein
MLHGFGATSSVIQAAGAPSPGVSARPNALVVLVCTNAPTPAATASSSITRVPVTLVSTNSWRLCDPTCGLGSARRHGSRDGSGGGVGQVRLGEHVGQFGRADPDEAATQGQPRCRVDHLHRGYSEDGGTRRQPGGDPGQ